jgi:hypothetical protein
MIWGGYEGNGLDLLFKDIHERIRHTIMCEHGYHGCAFLVCNLCSLNDKKAWDD